MEDTVFALMTRAINERKEDVLNHLSSGGAKSYDEYTHMTGMLRALVYIEDELKELEKRFIEE